MNNESIKQRLTGLKKMSSELKESTDTNKDIDFNLINAILTSSTRNITNDSKQIN